MTPHMPTSCDYSLCVSVAHRVAAAAAGALGQQQQPH
jgi:hypothetical protein